MDHDAGPSRYGERIPPRDSHLLLLRVSLVSDRLAVFADEPERLQFGAISLDPGKPVVVSGAVRPSGRPSLLVMPYFVPTGAGIEEVAAQRGR